MTTLLNEVNYIHADEKKQQNCKRMPSLTKFVSEKETYFQISSKNEAGR